MYVSCVVYFSVIDSCVRVILDAIINYASFLLFFFNICICIIYIYIKIYPLVQSAFFKPRNLPLSRVTGALQ